MQIGFEGCEESPHNQLVLMAEDSNDRMLLLQFLAPGYNQQDKCEISVSASQYNGKDIHGPKDLTLRWVGRKRRNPERPVQKVKKARK